MPLTKTRRRPRQRSGIQRVEQREYPAHLRYVRQHWCIVNGSVCGREVEAAHVRSGLPAGDEVGMGGVDERYILPGSETDGSIRGLQHAMIFDLAGDQVDIAFDGLNRPTIYYRGL